MKNKLYNFTFFDSFTQRIVNLEVKARTFAEAVPDAYIHRSTLNRRHEKSSWDIISVKSKAS